MAPVPDTRLATLATAVLAAAVARYAVSGQELPKRQYTHAGEVAYDKDQLVVTLARIAPGMPGNPSEVMALNGGPFAATATLEMHLVRCVPSPDARGSVSSTALNEHGQQALIDVRECMKALTASQHEFTPYCQLFAYTGSAIVGPEGGYVGVVTYMDVQM